ncbi:hypothetical protein MTO96_017296 [Rhipicephalus appendiculatus]
MFMCTTALRTFFLFFFKEEDDDWDDSVSVDEEDDTDKSVDLVSILKVKTPEQPQPVDKTWSALLVGAGVLLAVAAVGTLFYLTAMGFKASSSAGVKSRALRSGGGGGDGARSRCRHHLGNYSSDTASNASDSSTDSADKTKMPSKATSSASSRRSGSITTSRTGSITTSRTGTITTSSAGSITTSSTSGVRTHGNATTTKRSSSVPPATTRKPMTKTPLVCVFGNRIDWKMHFPDDGLCDFVFYDSLYGHPGQQVPRPTSTTSRPTCEDGWPPWRRTTSPRAASP